MSLPKAFIKNIAIKINDDYQLSNSPFEYRDSDTKSKSQKNKTFIGREDNKKKFRAFLDEDNRGVFLVTGYRGMGKTSFVNEILSDYNKENEKINVINITIAQKQPSEEELLRLIVATIYNKYKEKTKYDAQKRALDLRIRILKVLGISFLALAVIGLLVFFKDDYVERYKYLRGFINALAIISLVVIVLAAFFILPGVIKLTRRLNRSKLNDIETLFKRCYATYSIEKSAHNELLIEQWNTKMIGSSKKETVTYPIASSKEIEYELQKFLKNSPVKFVFVFDELDKIEPAALSTAYYEPLPAFEDKAKDSTYLQHVREKKQTIINIIAGLKNFFTTAEARFIFIAGREMFDATLADIADRQSAIGSIFNYVFYIESFLKEKVVHEKTNKASLSSAIEEYLFDLVLDKKTANRDLLEEFTAQLSSGRINFKSVNVKDEDTKGQIEKLVATLQNFVVYLTYRSNGSPKKLINLIQQFIKVGEIAATDDENNPTIIADCTSSTGKDNKKSKYLYFGFHHQYLIGFINYLYRPFLIRHGRNFKQYSDNIVVSTSYLFDHLLKFHPFAFSLTNLELIPEVLSTNKTSLREHIQEIISYLSNNHIRETEISLFDHKFYSRTLNEITFISKLFESESAAFNFTLDESYLVKLHIRGKIKELRSIYAKFDSPGSQQIFSIAFLNGILGDLHFFDQEYDDAIVAYADAIKPINHLVVSKMNMRDFITLIRFKLKLGLSFEKIKSYEEALSFYSDASQDAKRFLCNRLSTGEFIDIPAEKKRSCFHENENENFTTYHSSALSDLLQNINQCFLAELVLQEKMAMQGATADKLAITLGGFFKLSEGVKNICGPNFLINANAYLITGNLLYFKNSSKGFDNVDDIQIKFTDDYKRINALIGSHKNNYITQRVPLTSLVFYCLGMDTILRSLVNEYEEIALSKPNMVFDFTDKLKNDKYIQNEQFTKSHFKYIAIFFSNIGDCLLSMLKLDKGQDYHSLSVSSIFEIKYYTPSIKHYKPENFDACLIKRDPEKFQLRDVIFCYYLSGIYFLKRGRSVSCSFQFRKILHVLRLVLRYNQTLDDIEMNKTFIDFIEKAILKPILEITSENCEHSDSHMINKYKKIFDTETNHIFESEPNPYISNNISNHPEAREAILLFSYIKLKLTYNSDGFKKYLISPYNSIATQYARILELEFFTKLSYSQHKQNADNITHKAEYLWALFSITKILTIYGMDYLIGQSYLAYAHFRIAEFLEQTENILAEIKVEIGKWFSKSKSYTSFDIQHHYKMAKTYYQKAIELHTGGSEYKRVIGDMIYLEDDINDNAYHFGAALDRYMMVNDVFHEKIRICESKLTIDVSSEYLGF